MRNLLNTLSNVIDNVDDNDPMIVLGYFNEDVMTNHKSVLIEIMDFVNVYCMLQLIEVRGLT